MSVRKPPEDPLGELLKLLRRYPAEVFFGLIVLGVIAWKW